MYEKKIAKANWMAEAYYGLYGIVSDVEYILDLKGIVMVCGMYMISTGIT